MTGPVCITGATGFVGAHIVEAFLAAGIPVRAAVRSPEDREKVGPLLAMGDRYDAPLTLHRADLSEAGSYDAALDGCAGLVHVAAVARLTARDPQREIVDPAVAGTRNVLTSASQAGVRRVVMTSSVVACGSYRASERRPLTEADWNDAATLDTAPYDYAKTQQERLAWALAAEASWDLVTCNPALVLGPALTRRHCRASPSVVRDVLTGAFPANPAFCFGVVDARDVAQAHLEAWRRPEARGRHVLCAGNRWMQDMAVLLSAQFPGFPIRTGRLPNLALRVASLFDRRVDGNVLKDILDREPRIDGAHATAALGITYRDLDETVVDTARSMVEGGFVSAR